MAHYAKVKDGIVINVIVAEPDFFTNLVEIEPGEWIQTSYNTFGGVHYDPNTGLASEDQSKALRKNYANIGGTYDKIKDAFIPPKPYNSWTLNETTCRWEAPVAYPADDKNYIWNEETTSWDLVSE
jgi:hypothetical protein